MRTNILAIAVVVALASVACGGSDTEPPVETGATSSGVSSSTASQSENPPGQGATGSPIPGGEGCTEASAIDLTGDEPAELEIEDFAYVPDCVIIAKGGSVRIRNRDSFTHTFTVDALGIVVPIDPRAEIRVKSKGAGPHLETGANPFHCDIHPQMTGTIFVTG
jgi:plastocyanin